MNNKLIIIFIIRVYFSIAPTWGIVANYTISPEQMVLFNECTMNICTQEDEIMYPTKAIEEALINIPMSELFFDTLYRIKRMDNIDISACKSRLISIFPFAMKNLDNEWKYIVNVKEAHQSFEFNVCENSTKKCECVDLLGGKCLQSYRTIWMLTFDGHLKYDQFKIPNDCECLNP